MSEFSVFGAEMGYILAIAAIMMILVQLLKGHQPEEGVEHPEWFRRFQLFLRPVLPWIIAVVACGLGVGVAALYARSLFTGAVEGFVGAAVSMGIYEIGSITPGLDRVLERDGWL